MTQQSGRVLLGVNVDHVATLREARGTRYPDPVQAAMLAEEAGADGITVHPREDRRHIQDRDVRILSETLTTRMNLEMAVTDAMLAFAETIRPAHCCFVPEKREELTTEGGLDVAGQPERIRAACERMAAMGTEVSLFIDADPAHIRAAADCGAPAIELHTGEYALAETPDRRNRELERLRDCIGLAREQGLVVNGGHGLHYHNTAAIAALDGLNELNIGHAIMARALMTGMKEAVQAMRALIDQASGVGAA